jgi:hypothetical protein
MMKRFTVVTALFGISLLAVWMIFQTSAASSKTQDNTTENPVYSGNEVVVPVTRPEMREVAPVYDANGQLVSDPTGTIWNAAESHEMRVAPVYDSSGALISDPTGTVSNANDAGNMKIAPVFDASGRLVSDPTGTIWSSDNS